MTKDVPVNPIEGNHVTLTCVIIDGIPRDDITKVTRKNGDKTLPTSSRHQLIDNKTILKISSLSHVLDDGHYCCGAANEAGMGDFIAKFSLQINCKCNIHNIFHVASEFATHSCRHCMK